MKEAYDTNWMSTVGANIDEVERLACEETGCKYAVPFWAGRPAGLLAVGWGDVKRGGKVFCRQ